MSENRVIGQGNKIPWHLPEDFAWFKKMTTGAVIIMGRMTFESLPGSLPNRRQLVLTRHPRMLINQRPETFGQFKEWRGGKSLARKIQRSYQMRFTKFKDKEVGDLMLFRDLSMINPADFPCDVFICGGGQIYEQTLPMCSDLYLTVVKRIVPGDTFFPHFEDAFELVEILSDQPEFRILHYRNRAPAFLM